MAFRQRHLTEMNFGRGHAIRQHCQLLCFFLLPESIRIGALPDSEKAGDK
jgi:hypothetical protein